MNRILKVLFFLFFVRPLVLIGLGLNIVNRPKLPRSGPAIIAANHNSHLDALVLMSLFPLRQLHRVRPVAAADYFLANRFRAWLSRDVIGILPFDRSGETEVDGLFDRCQECLDNGDILVLFPEGSRGDPEKLSRIRKGIYHLLEGYEHVPVVPVVMHGLGKALPRGEALFVPFNCDVVVGESLFVHGKANEFVKELTSAYETQLRLCLTRRLEVEE